MVMRYMRLFFIGCMLMLSGLLLAQHNEQVTVEGTYRPKVNKVDKITLTPEIPETSFSFPDSDVEVKDVEHKFDIDLEKLSPVGHSSKNDVMVEPTENFLMAGLGSLVSPLFLYRHNSQLSRNIDLGVGVQHFSSWLNRRDYAPSSFMDNDLNLDLNVKLDGYQLNNKVYYANNMVHYYGYRLSDSLFASSELEQKCPRQTYNTIGVNSTLSSTDTRLGAVQHGVGMGYRYTYDRFGAAEHFLDLNGNVHYAEKWWGDKESRQSVGANLGFVYDHYGSGFGRIPIAGHGRFIIRFNPYFSMKGGFYRLHLGLRLESVGPSGHAIKTYLTIRPDIEGSLYVFDKKVEFYTGLGGGRRLYSYCELIGENPFIHPTVPLRFQNLKLAFDAGMRSNILNCIDLHLGVRYRNADDDYFFVPSLQEDIYNSFTLGYDHVEKVLVLADMRYKYSGNLNVEGHLAYNHYDTDVEQHAWYRPKFKAKAKASYFFDENLGFNASLLLATGRYAKLYNDGNVALPVHLTSGLDLSLGVDYKLNEQIGLFATVDNMLNSRYHLYLNYPVTGFQLFGGIKAKF